MPNCGDSGFVWISYKLIQNATERININGLPQGVYAIILKEKDNIIATDKVMVK